MTDNALRNKAIVREFLTKTFTDRDFTALERWLSPDYIQHNPFIPAKRAGLRPGGKVSRGQALRARYDHHRGRRSGYGTWSLFRRRGQDAYCRGHFTIRSPSNRKMSAAISVLRPPPE